jgi:hypothetical protein
MKNVYRPFCSLPDPLVRYILTFLAPRHMSLSCTLVSKRFCAECTNAAITVVDQLSRQHAWVQTLISTIHYEFTAGDVAPTNLPQHGNNPNMVHVLHIITSPQIVLVGGNSEPRRVDSYDVLCNRWNELAETEVVREVFFEVLCHDGFVYVFCGIHHASYGKVERLNPLTNQWTSVTPLPGKLAAVVGAVLNGNVYIVGGYDWHLAKYSDAVFEMDVVEGLVTWTQLDCRMRMGRSSHACVAFQNKLWVAGGISDEGDSEGNPTVEVLDPAVGYWVQGPELTMRRFRLRLFVVCDELYAVGGDRDERGRLIIQSIEKLSGNGLSWSHVTFFKVERRGFLSSVVGTKIYIIGGRTGEVPLTTWDCYDVTTGQWLSDVYLMGSHGTGQGLTLDDLQASMYRDQQGQSPKRAKVASAYGYGGAPEAANRMSLSMCVNDETSWLASSSSAAKLPESVACSSRSNATNSGQAEAMTSTTESPPGATAAAFPSCNAQALPMGVRSTSSMSRVPPTELFDASFLSAAHARAAVSGIKGELDVMDIEVEDVTGIHTGALFTEVLAPSSETSDSLLCAHQSRLLSPTFPNVILHRVGGVVGGRAVTLPEEQLTW